MNQRIRRFFEHPDEGRALGVSPNDPLTFLAVAAVLLAVAVGACLMPAHRATMVNPIAARRTD